MDKFLFDNPTYNIVLKGNATGLFGLDEGNFFLFLEKPDFNDYSYIFEF